MAGIVSLLWIKVQKNWKNLKEIYRPQLNVGKNLTFCRGNLPPGTNVQIIDGQFDRQLS